MSHSVPRLQGIVKRLIAEKGFGFIRHEASGVEYFFHRSGVRETAWDDLYDGIRVTFEIEPSAKGPRAAEVRVVL